MDSSFVADRITATKVLIVAYEGAVEALVSGQVQQYTLDTGQSRQSVTKANIAVLNDQIDLLYNRCATLEARLNGAGIIGRPDW